MGTIQDGYDQAKAWYKSKTIIGIVIAAISTLVGAFYPSIDIQGGVNELLNANDLVSGVDSIWVSAGQAIGLVLALWGRIKASVGIKSVI